MTRTILLLFSCLFTLNSLPLRAEDTNLILRMFPIPPESIHIDPPTEPDHNSPIPHGPSRLLDSAKEFYQKCGVMFPPGSYIAYNPRASLLEHYNTEENQKRFGHILEQIEGVPFQIQLDATFVDFSREDMEILSRASSSASPGTADLLQLWKSGKGTLLHTLKLTTRSGVNAQVQAVSEIIYPTSFRMPDASNSTAALVQPLPIPDFFETREVGAIFNVTPTVGPDNRTIDIVMAPEITAPPEWQTRSVTGTDAKGQSLRLDFPQPVFHSRNITTCIILRDGETAVLGGMNNPQGNAITYLFLTATLLDSAGRPLANYAGESPLLPPP